jgi:hypothetical protein
MMGRRLLCIVTLIAALGVSAQGQECAPPVQRILRELTLVELPRHVNMRGSVQAKIVVGADRRISIESMTGPETITTWLREQLAGSLKKVDGLAMPMTLDVEFEFRETPRPKTPSVQFPDAGDLNQAVITLFETGCFGKCPNYTLEIHGDGTVEYEGFHYVDRKGKHRGRISKKEFEALVAVFRKADYFSLEDFYTFLPPDMDVTARSQGCVSLTRIGVLSDDTHGVVTSIQIGGHSKTIRNESRQPLPALAEIEKELRKVAERWTRRIPVSFKRARP